MKIILLTDKIKNSFLILHYKLAYVEFFDALKRVFIQGTNQYSYPIGKHWFSLILNIRCNFDCR